MPIIECQSHAEYLKELSMLQEAGRHVLSIYLYWYEGAGTRKLKILPGAATKAFWSTLPVEQQGKVTFASMSPEGHSAETLGLVKQYNDAMRTDFESTGGYTEVDGRPEDAVIVIEYK